jgi:hypothetical protein
MKIYIPALFLGLHVSRAQVPNPASSTGDITFLGEISLPSQGIAKSQEEGKAPFQDPFDEHDYENEPGLGDIDDALHESKTDARRVSIAEAGGGISDAEQDEVVFEEPVPLFILTDNWPLVNISDAPTPNPNAGGLTVCDEPSPQFIDRCIDSDKDLALNGVIPPDPHGAAGPNSIIAVTNKEIELRRKTGESITAPTPLSTMFGRPLRNLYDPKILYDVHQQRFVVVVLDSDQSTFSSILVAVSITSDPTDTSSNNWYFSNIDSLIDNAWADYPGIAVDEEALYITTNMFSTRPNGGFDNCRLWIVNKSPLYSGGAISFTQHDFIDEAGNGSRQTHMPAMVRESTGIAPNVGTYLVAYGGLSRGGDELIQIIQVDSPLTSPVFTQVFVNVGDIEDSRANLINAPQQGSRNRIEVNDRRALDAVWVNNELWMVTTVRGMAGVTSAYWLKFNADGEATPTIADQGFMGGEDIGSSTYTFFASIDVNSKGVAAFGFAASSSTIYASAYATIRDDTMDTPGTVRSPELVKAGTAPYFITFRGSRNRWGDYTGMALDPVEDDCFWAFNEYASEPCFTGSGGQSGCWKTGKCSGKVVP